MKIKLIAVGDLQQTHFKEATAQFEKRLSHYASFETIILKPEKPSGKNNQESIRKESELILKKIGNRDFVVALDEKGKSLGSEGLAELFRKLMNQSTPGLVFIIGGSYGLSEEIRKKADFVLSLSSMTFTHEMARLFITEQIYRAMTILKNEKYHH